MLSLLPKVNKVWLLSDYFVGLTTFPCGYNVSVDPLQTRLL